MITKKPIPDGVLLRVKPFSEPNRNAGCELLARVTSSQGTRRDVQVFIGNLNNVMALTDVTILMTALRALTVRAAFRVHVHVRREQEEELPCTTS